MTHGIQETVARGICIGCGVCSAATGGAIRLTLGPTRVAIPNLDGVEPEDLRIASRVCPFSDDSPNETELGAPASQTRPPRFDQLGAYTRTFAGRLTDTDALDRSSSGGLTSWLAGELIRRGLVDEVISVGPEHGNPNELFAYAAHDSEGLLATRKSHYVAASLADALDRISDAGGRFAIVGVPCVIRGVRALCRERPEFADRVQYVIALVCGHAKTPAYAESLAWQVGVEPGALDRVDFRIKHADRGANDYNFGARARGDHEWHTAPARDLVGANWGHSAFQPEACNFCDDVVGETADVSFGDAWLPHFAADSRGTNIVVSRNAELDAIFDEGRRSGSLEIFEADADDVVESQAGGFRQRREALSVRLADDTALGLSVPRKRVSPTVDPGLSPRRVALIRQRRRMAESSHAAFARARAAGDLDLYLTHERAEIRAYRRLDLSFARRAVLRVKGALRAIASRVGLRS